MEENLSIIETVKKAIAPYLGGSLNMHKLEEIASDAIGELYDSGVLQCEGWGVNFIQTDRGYTLEIHIGAEE